MPNIKNQAINIPINVNGVEYTNKKVLDLNHIYDVAIASSNANLFNGINAQKKIVWSNSVQPFEKFLRKGQLFSYFKKAEGFKEKMSVLFQGPLYLYEKYKKGNIPKGLRPLREKKAAWFVIPFFLLSLGIALVALFNGKNLALTVLAAIFVAVWIMTYIIGHIQDSQSTN